MSSNDFLPAITSLNLCTSKSSEDLFLFQKEDNYLHISCVLSGLNRRTLPVIHETPNYFAVYFTLFHQFGGRETTIVRRYMVEYDSDTERDNKDTINLDVPIDDDFLGIDFISDYYFLEISFTEKHPDEMGISESIFNGVVFNTKIPFILKRGTNNG